MAPIDLGPAPDTEYPDGSQQGSFDASGNVYEKQELLHRPHAFALMHGTGGAKVAFGQLQWRIDTITLRFEQSSVTGVSVTVDDHPDHSHAPHANHSHSDHTDHSHADHTDHPSHTHEAGVASHTHNYPHTHTHDHTHELNHVHSHSHAHTVNSHSHTITDDIHQGHTGAGTGGSGGTDLFGSGTYTSDDPSTGSYDEGNEYTHDHGGTTSSESPTTGTPTTINTDQPDDATTDSISSTTTSTSSPSATDSNDPSASGTSTTSGPNAALSHSSHSGVKTTSHGTPASDSGILDHSNAVNTDGSALGTDAAGVLKHSGVKDVSDGTSSAPSGVLQHNVTVSGGLNTITYCSGAAQDPISNINVQIPKVDAEDGPAMEATVHGQGQDDPYHQLSSYGDVYLVWVVNLENAGTEVEKCWVQVGEPTGDQISDITMGTATTNRRTATDPSDGTGLGEGEGFGVFKIKLGTVNEGSQIVQNITSDVVWTTTVMDRIFA